MSLANYVWIPKRIPSVQFLLLIFIVLVVGLTARDADAQSQRITDPAILDPGRLLFQQNCAECHGQNAEGTAENWRVPGDDGKYPPPPLNGTAHAWHHSMSVLARTIRNGTLAMGGSMPAWKDTLSDDEIYSIIVWITSTWPDEIYQSWMKRNTQ